MLEAGTIWFDELKKFVAEARLRDPLPDRSTLDRAQEIQCRIVGGSIISCFQRTGPEFLQERAALGHLRGLEPDPYIVFTTNLPGLVAVAEIFPEPTPEIAFLDPQEFSEWSSQNPDPTYAWHVHAYSFFRASVSVKDLGESADRFPLAPGIEYWQHTEGSWWGELAGRGGEHLWSWDGENASLLEEAFSQWVS
jgi:hypothetical protein